MEEAVGVVKIFKAQALFIILLFTMVRVSGEISETIAEDYKEKGSHVNEHIVEGVSDEELYNEYIKEEEGTLGSIINYESKESDPQEKGSLTRKLRVKHKEYQKGLTNEIIKVWNKGK